MIPKEEILTRAACLLELAAGEIEKDRTRRTNKWKEEQQFIADAIRDLLAHEALYWQAVAKDARIALAKRNRQVECLRRALGNLLDEITSALSLHTAIQRSGAMHDAEAALQNTKGWNVPPCTHERLNEDGVCRTCGADRRGI